MLSEINWEAWQCFFLRARPTRVCSSSISAKLLHLSTGKDRLSHRMSYYHWWRYRLLEGSTTSKNRSHVEKSLLSNMDFSMDFYFVILAPGSIVSSASYNYNIIVPVDIKSWFVIFNADVCITLVSVMIFLLCLFALTGAGPRGMYVNNLPIFTRIASLALEQSYDSPFVSEAMQTYMDTFQGWF